jgi:hypothetical protein
MEMIRKVIDAGTRTRKWLEEVESLERWGNSLPVA